MPAPDRHATVAHALDALAGDATLTVIGRGDERATIDHEELGPLVRGAAGALRARGLGPGSMVGVVLPTTLPAIVAALGVLRSGAALVPVAPRSKLQGTEAHRSGIEDIAARLGLALVLGPKELGTAVPSISYADLEAEHDVDADVPLPPVDSIGMISMTSGTTGRGRAVAKSQAALAMDLTKPDGPPDVLVRRLGWLALHHRGLMTEVLKPLACGTDTTVLPPELFAARPRRWLEEIDAGRITVSGGPVSAYRVAARALEEAPEPALDLSCWRLARCSAEVIEEQTLLRFARVAEPYGFDPRSFMTAYGMSEAGVIAGRRGGVAVDRVDRGALGDGVARAASPDDADPACFVSVGPAFDGVEISIVDRAGEPVGERTVGEVVVRSGGLMLGYLDDPEATAAALVDGTLRTGDLGYLAGGELHLVGRIKDTIVIRGRTIAATDVERIADAVAGVELSVAVGIRDGDTDALVLVVESDTDDGTLERTVAEAVVARSGYSPSRVRVVAPGSLPRTDTGKVQRAKVRELVQEPVGG